MRLYFKKIHENAKAPVYSSLGAAGCDLMATSKRYDADRQYYEYGTGIAVEIPEGYVGKIYPRSSISNRGLLLCNSCGIIDSDYRGEIVLRFYDATFHCDPYNVGERLGQLVIEPSIGLTFEEKENLSTTRRGAGGYGSTGK